MVTKITFQLKILTGSNRCQRLRDVNRNSTIHRRRLYFHSCWEKIKKSAPGKVSCVWPWMLYLLVSIIENIILIYYLFVFVNLDETSRYGMTGYRYEVPPTTFNRTQPEYDDCYRGNSLPNGLADVSTCYNSKLLDTCSFVSQT